MAKAGLRVAVFEKNSWVGGMSSTYEFIPGYKFGTGAMYFGAMPPQIREDLELYEHGLKEEVTLPWVFCPLPDGKYFTEFFPDTDKTCAFLEQNFTKQDAVAYRKWAELWASLNEALGPVMMNVPPSFPTSSRCSRRRSSRRAPGRCCSTASPSCSTSTGSCPTAPRATWPTWPTTSAGEGR